MDLLKLLFNLEYFLLLLLLLTLYIIHLINIKKKNLCIKFIMKKNTEIEVWFNIVDYLASQPNQEWV